MILLRLLIDEICKLLIYSILGAFCLTKFVLFELLYGRFYYSKSLIIGIFAL